MRASSTCAATISTALTTHVVNSAAVIAIEDLNLKAMGRSLNRGFRRSVSDARLGEIRRHLTYKAKWHQRILVVVDRFYPSSKTCSDCGEINGDLKLKDRSNTLESISWTANQVANSHH